MKCNKYYPIEKYKMTVEGSTVTAESSYAGNAVVGRAKCDPRDNFNEEDGKKLAAARCNLKVAEKRVKRATTKLAEQKVALSNLIAEIEKTSVYVSDAKRDKKVAEAELNSILEKM